MSIPTVTTSAVPPGSTIYVLASSASRFQASSFANDLFNSLAPLLTLFGEQPTRQYLSMSLSLADHVLLGIAPIGIITIVVSAIRISGSPLLKTFVGRSRENRASIEAEVSSSTSARVRELWDGERIVREAGENRTTEVIYSQIPRLKTGKMRVKTFSNAVPGGTFSSMYQLQTTKPSGDWFHNCFWSREEASGSSRISTSDREPAVLKERLQTEAPNISLNVPGAIASRLEIWALSAIGYVIQLTVLTISGLSTYKWDWRFQEGQAIPVYAFPCFAIGTILITIFSTICGYIIEATTTKEVYEPTETKVFVPTIIKAVYEPRDAESFTKGTKNAHLVFRVQRESTIGRQDLPPYSIFNGHDDPLIRTVRPNKRQFKLLTLLSTFMTIIGFTTQFIGIRGMHWSIALMQLGANLITTGLRIWARRGMTRRPEVLLLENSWEAVDLALHIRACDKWQILTGKFAGALDFSPTPETPLFKEPEGVGSAESAYTNKGIDTSIQGLYQNADRSMEPSTKQKVRWLSKGEAFFADGSKTPRNLGHRTLELQRHLQKIFPGSKEIDTITSKICEAITKICNFVSSSEDIILANLDAFGQPIDSMIRWSFDVLIEGKSSSGVPPGLVELSLSAKWPKNNNETVVYKNDRKRIRSIIALTYRALLKRKLQPSFPAYCGRLFFMRIVGYQDFVQESWVDHSEPLNSSEYLQRWLGPVTSYPTYHKMPLPDGTKPMLAVDALVETAPAFGVKFSSLYKAANLTAQLTQISYAHETVTNRQNSARFLEGSLQGAARRPYIAATELVFLSEANLLDNVALEILSTFMLALTAGIEKLGASTTEVRSDANIHWENEVLEKLATILIDLKLAPNMVTAKSVIIPAFATRWLLPPKTATTAAEGMKNAQMPPDWVRAVSKFGRTYFINHKAKITSWIHPWYQKPEDLWREMHSENPPPTYTMLLDPEEPQPNSWASKEYPPSLQPEQAHSRGIYQYELATKSAKVRPGSIYSTSALPREENHNDSQVPHRPASR